MRAISCITYLCFNLLLFGFTGDKVKSDLVLANIKGKVKTTVESEYEAVKVFSATSSGHFQEADLQKGDLLSKMVTNYNEKGDETEKITYAPDGAQKEKMTSKYDVRSNKTERICYAADGSFSAKYLIRYDKNGDETEKTLLTSGGTIKEKSIFTSDESGYKRIETVCNDRGAKISKKTWRYDDNGNVTDYKEYNAIDSLQTTWIYMYKEYDKTGNWTKRVGYKNFDAENIVERALEYW